MFVYITELVSQQIISGTFANLAMRRENSDELCQTLANVMSQWRVVFHPATVTMRTRSHDRLRKQEAETTRLIIT